MAPPTTIELTSTAPPTLERLTLATPPIFGLAAPLTRIRLSIPTGERLTLGTPPTWERLTLAAPPTPERLILGSLPTTLELTLVAPSTRAGLILGSPSIMHGLTLATPPMRAGLASVDLFFVVLFILVTLGALEMIAILPVLQPAPLSFVTNTLETPSLVQIYMIKISQLKTAGATPFTATLKAYLLTVNSLIQNRRIILRVNS